jgi:hypothetical protein
LHQHPSNAARRERGLPAINALWVWGGGVLPDRASLDAARVFSDDDSLRDHARFAAVSDFALPNRFDAVPAQALSGLYDLRRLRDPKRFQDDWLRPALSALHSKTLRAVTIDSADGARLRLEARHGLRFWRRPWSPPTSVEA